MVIKVETNFAVAKKRPRRGVTYRSPRIYLPTKLTDDSSFPFREGDKLVIRISSGHLIVERAGRRNRRLRKRRKR